MYSLVLAAAMTTPSTDIGWGHHLGTHQATTAKQSRGAGCQGSTFMAAPQVTAPQVSAGCQGTFATPAFAAPAVSGGCYGGVAATGAGTLTTKSRTHTRTRETVPILPLYRRP